MKLPHPLVAAIEVAFNRAISFDDNARNQFIAMSGKVIALHLSGLELVIYLAPSLDGVQLLAEYAAEADTTIQGTPLALLATAVNKTKAGVISGDVVISGDLELGQKFQRILENVDIDFEEPLSQVVGDVVAHQMGSVARDGLSWFDNTLNTFALDSVEYFSEESKDIVTNYELEVFNQKVDVLRNDCDRLELRIENLLQRLEGLND